MPNHQGKSKENSHWRAGKTCAVRPFCARVARKLWAAEPSKCPMGHEANASSGALSKAESRGTRNTRDKKTRTVSNAESTLGSSPEGWGHGRGGAFQTAVRGTMFVCNGAVTPEPSRECNITFFVNGRPKTAQQL